MKHSTSAVPCLKLSLLHISGISLTVLRIWLRYLDCEQNYSTPVNSIRNDKLIFVLGLVRSTQHEIAYRYYCSAELQIWG